MRKFFGSRGSVGRATVESQALKSNMLGDPSVRVVDVYVPAGHNGQGLPLLVILSASRAAAYHTRIGSASARNLPERLDRLIGEQKMSHGRVGRLSAG